jgi:hypothetical protein
MTDKTDKSPPPPDPLALEDCDYDRKYLLVSVPDFDVDPVDGDGKRRMTSYLRLGTVPDDWKSLPGADLELAVHADYGIGGGPDRSRPVASVDPDPELPADPTDPRYVAPSPDSLAGWFIETVSEVLGESAQLPAVVAWATAEQALVTSARSVQPLDDFGRMAPREDRYPDVVTAEHFAKFIRIDGESIAATIEARLQSCALGGPTSPLTESEAKENIDKMGLKTLAAQVLVIRTDPEPPPKAPEPTKDDPYPAPLPDPKPWVVLAAKPFAEALEAICAEAATRAVPRLVEGFTDYPDMLVEYDDANGDKALKPKYPPFVDDYRYRGTSDEGEYLTSDDRFKNSRYLHTRGGWRDHSDGNRISTTYGDKVEVIRGNYKLMVLGRQDDPGSSNLVDYSGQVTQSDDNMLLRVEYTRDDKAGKQGMWNWETVNENVIQSERVSGKTYSWWYGVEQIEVVGSDSPTEVTSSNPLGIDDSGLCRANPEVTSRTWARWTKEYSGSAKLPIGSSYSETWVDETEEKTTVTRGTISTTTVGLGTIETTTVGGGTISTTTVGGGTLETTTVGGAAIALEAVVGAKVEITGVAATIIELTTSLTKFEASAHLVHVELAAVGLHAELKATGIDIELSMTGLKLEGELSGPTKDLNQHKDESAISMTHTFTQYTRTSASDKLSYMTSSETGTSKTLTLSDLRVVAGTISLG